MTQGTEGDRSPDRARAVPAQRLVMPTPPPPASRPRTLPASSHICRSVSRPCRATRTAGVTLLEHDRPKTFAYTNGEAAEVDELQYDEGDGPCLTAYRQQEVIRVESNRTEELAGVLPPSPAARRPDLPVPNGWSSMGPGSGPSTSPATPTAPPPTPLLRLIPFKAFPIRWQDSGSGVFTLATASGLLGLALRRQTVSRVLTLRDCRCRRAPR